MVQLLGRFFRNEDGATSIEYALIASLVSIVIVGGAMSLGGKLNATYTSVASKL
jgi:pilus assembly protein Flp/PilA